MSRFRFATGWLSRRKHERERRAGHHKYRFVAEELERCVLMSTFLVDATGLGHAMRRRIPIVGATGESEHLGHAMRRRIPVVGVASESQLLAHAMRRRIPVVG